MIRSFFQGVCLEISWYGILKKSHTIKFGVFYLPPEGRHIFSGFFSGYEKIVKKNTETISLLTVPICN